LSGGSKLKKKVTDEPVVANQAVSLRALRRKTLARQNVSPCVVRMPEETHGEMMTGSAQHVAKRFHVDPATVRRWPANGCPIIRRGRPGPGRGYLFDLEQVAKWRDRANAPPGLSVDDVLQRIALALWEAVEKDHADIRAGIMREDAAAAFLVVWERCCKHFNVNFKFDQQPDPIRALMRNL
jgi:hypothetical protein